MSLGGWVDSIFPGIGGLLDGGGGSLRPAMVLQDVREIEAGMAPWSEAVFGTELPSMVVTTPTSLVGQASIVAGAGVLADAPAIGGADMFDEWDFGDDSFVEGDSIDFSGGDVDLGGGQFNIPTGAIMNYLGGGGGAQVTRTGAFGGAAAMGAGVALRSLWGVLRAGGSRFSTFAINGVKGKLSDLWPAVRQYGPQAVATALGIGAAELGQMLMASPQGGRKKRARGISAGDVRRTRRVMGTMRRMNRQLGMGGGGGYRRGAAPRGRGRGGRARWVRVDGY